MDQISERDHVDEETLAEVLMLLEDESPDGMQRMCAAFLAGVPDRMAGIDTALAAGRLEDAAHASHMLRGSAGAFGARRLSALGMRLEQDCVRSDAAAATTLVAEMRTEFEVFRAILEDRLRRLSA